MGAPLIAQPVTRHKGQAREAQQASRPTRPTRPTRFTRLTRRTMLQAGAALAVAPLAAACQGGAGSSDAAPRPAAGPVKLTLLHAWGAGGRLPLMEKMRDDFQQRNPTITVEFDVITTEQGMTSPRVQKLVTAVAGGTPPDVSMIWRGELPALAIRGMLQPLDALISKEKFNPKMYYDAEWETSRFQNKAYVLPNVSAGGWDLLYYNRTHFREAGLDPDRPPTKWAEATDHLRRLTKTEGGAITRLGGQITGGAEGFILWTLNNKGKFLSPDGKKALFDSPETVEALEWWSTFFEPIGGRAAVTAFNAPYQGRAGDQVAFTLGAQSMEMPNPSRIFHIKTGNPSLDYGIAVPPFGPRDTAGKSIIRGGWGYGVPGGVKNPYESWLLTRWLSATKEAAGWFMQQQLRPSPMKEVNEDKFYLDQAPRTWPQLLKAMEKDVAVPITPVDAETDAVLNKAMTDVAEKRGAVRDVVRQAAADVQRELDTFWARQSR